MSVKELSKPQLAELFGESTKQITRYVAEGMPCSGTGHKQRFPWPEVRGWRDERIRKKEREKLERDKPLDFEEAKRRKMEAEAKLAELEYDKNVGAVVPLDAVSEAVGALCERLLPILQNVPSNYGLRLEELGIPAEKAERVLESIATDLTKALHATNETLDALADDDAGDYATAGDDDRDHHAA